MPAGGRARFEAASLFLGPADNALEVVVATSEQRPNLSDTRKLWERRHGNRPSPVLLVVLYEGADGCRAAVCGPIGDAPPVHIDLDPGQVERIAAAALAEPDRHAAMRLLNQVLPEAPTELPGIRNVGMLATHHLRTGVPARPDWRAACAEGRPLLTSRGRQLIEALGYVIEPKSATTSILVARGRKRAVAVLLEDKESPEGLSERFGGTDPVSHAMAVAVSEGLPYVVLTRGTQIRIYASGSDVGVGRKGRNNTFIEANLALLPDEQAGYLMLLFSAQALLPEGSFEDILDRSRDFAADLGRRLRERVYKDVIPKLATAVARHHRAGEEVTEANLQLLYEQALLILFRLLFIAYAEDKGLLPYEQNDLYKQNSLKTLARGLAERRNQGPLTFDQSATDLWAKMLGLFRTVDKGQTEWGVPPYNGGLFSSDPIISEIGAELTSLELTNDEVGPALLGLLVDEGTEGFGPVDFRSLSVREFGTIYEGLLESRLSVAPVNLALDGEGNYVPAEASDGVIVGGGDIYIHNRSGARKPSGSYFTKPFAVEHLLDHALEPALDRHIERLQQLMEEGETHRAADAFFDFRVADIAMGSGHFLVAAVDRIEARLSSFLALQPVPGVISELERLRKAAADALAPLHEGVEIEHASLLRRQVGRRCIYGVDINPMAVELARLAIWIHTFVPGLPLSFLDHNLVVGNSLTGIGTIDEALRILDPDVAEEATGTVSIFRDQIVGWLRGAEDSLGQLARISEATKREIEEARRAQRAAETAVEPAHVLFDLLTGIRLGEVPRFEVLSDETVMANPSRDMAEQIAEESRALHFPIAFPEVFLSSRGGFDCIIGNPPWDKVRFEPQQFWVSRAPGLNAVPARRRPQEIEDLRRTRPTDAALEQVERAERERLQQYIERAFRFQGRGQHGHHDLAKVFVERALDLLAGRGHLGYVLPRVCLVLGGWTDLRRQLLGQQNITALQARNRGGWLFEDIHFSTMIVLLTRGPCLDGEPARAIIWPSVTGEGQLRAASVESGFTLSADQIQELTDRFVLPWFNDQGDLPLFGTMLSHPRLGSDKGWITGTADSARWDFSGTGRHRRYVTAQETSGAWRVMMTRHVLPFRIDRTAAFQRYVPHPEELAGLGLGVEIQRGSPVVGADHPLIVYRYPARNDDTRTLIATCLPERGVLPSKGYVHGILHPEPAALVPGLALLAYLNSFTCDWWVRRFVDRHLTLPVLTNIPLPDWEDDQIEQAATLSSSLLARLGTERLAGGHEVKEAEALGALEEFELLAAIEHLVLAGFGLESDTLEAILKDFSAEACPPPLRDALFKEPGR